MKPLTLLVLVALIALPWTFKFHVAFDADPSTWLIYAGALVGVGGALGCSYAYEAAQSARGNSTSRDLIYIAAVGGFIAIGFLTIALSNSIYARSRLMLQRTQMEAFVAGAAACPAMTCLREAQRQAAFVWGSNDRTWTGLCYDETGALVGAQRSNQAAREAHRRQEPRLYRGAVTVAERISDKWYRCAVTTRGLT